MEMDKRALANYKKNKTRNKLVRREKKINLKTWKSVNKIYISLDAVSVPFWKNFRE